jgi:predicted phage-related endonuclease
VSVIACGPDQIDYSCQFTGYYTVVDAESNTERWLRLRQSGIGASESAAILGETAWGTPLTIYNAKIADEVVDVATDTMILGHLMEDTIEGFLNMRSERYPQIAAIEPSPGLLRSTQWEWMLATLDRIAVTPDGQRVPLEFKSVNDYVAAEWRVDAGPVGDPDDPFAPKGQDARYHVPRKYQVQVQQQMAVWGSDYAYVAVMLGKDRVELIRVERDNAFIAEYLIGTVGDFWAFNVQARVPPAPNPRDDLWAIWPGEPGTEVIATDEALEHVYLYRRAGVDKRLAQEDYEAQKFELAKFMGNGTRLVHKDSGEVVHTLNVTAGRTTIDAKKLEQQYPDVYADVVRQGKPTRTHRATKAEVDFD